MNNKKVFFITTTDIYDQFGDGGVKGTQKNYNLLKDYFGKENVLICTFRKKYDTLPPEGAITFDRTHTPVGQLIAALFGCKVYFPWKEKILINFIKNQNIDILFIDGALLGRLVKVNLPCKTIVFYHNIEADYAWNKVKNEGPQYLPSYWASKYNDKCGIKADKVICLNTKDSNRLKQLYNREADLLLPVSFTDVFNVNKTIKKYKREIMFFGSLFPPNQKSIEWFIREVMPLLNNISLNIIGKGFERLKQKYEITQNVHVIGKVNEPDKYYYCHSAVVLPIQYGAGMKVKTAEAMMYGRRIFASNEALEGYDVENISSITRCNSAEEFANSISYYFDKEELKPYEPEVRKLFLNKYETSCLKMEFNGFIEQFTNY